MLFCCRTKIVAPPGILGTPAPAGAAEWVSKAAARAGGSRALLSVAISTDGHYLAVGGGDRKVHVWDARSRQYIQVHAIGDRCLRCPFEARREVERCNLWIISYGSRISRPAGADWGLGKCEPRINAWILVPYYGINRYLQFTSPTPGMIFSDAYCIGIHIQSRSLVDYVH